MSKILIVDDDKNLLEVAKCNLVNAGYSVVLAGSGTQAVEIALQEKPDLILLNLILQGVDGYEVFRILSKEMSVPILIISAKTDEIDKVVALELGADDYISKPFSIQELVARVRAVFRREQLIGSQISQHPKIDKLGHQVFMKGSTLNLSPKEFNLLCFLMENKGQVFTREQIMERVWGCNSKSAKRTVDAHIKCLRRKIEDDPHNPKLLVTVDRYGYKYEN